MPVGDHLEELRWRLLRSIIYIFAFSIVVVIFYSFVWDFVMGPLAPIINEAPSYNITGKVITTQLGDYFALKLKIMFLVGLILALPVILFEIWGFIIPALDKAFRKMGNGLLIGAILLFWGGVLTARYFIWPLVAKFLIYDWLPPPISLGASEQIIRPEVHLTINDYLSFFFGFHFGFGIAFELPIISMVLAAMGILRSRIYLQSWRVALVAIAVISAMLTPPDIFSMIAMMLPLTVLYCLSALLVFIVEKREN